MSRKQREREYALESAHAAWLNEQAKSTSSIKTTSFIKPLTSSQRAFVKSIKFNDITVGFGPAGTGSITI